MRLAVIPARGGSKRIPKKNIKPFFGKPMIAWSIEAARKSKCFDKIIVSTDDDEIADIAQTYGAEVPFRRTAELSDDHTGTIPVVAHAVKWQIENGFSAKDICCIYATAPFLNAEVLQQSLKEFQKSGADYAFSVTSYPFPIQRALRITSEDRVQMFDPEQFLSRSQDLEEGWHDAGQFYWGKKDAWLAQKPFFSQDSAPIRLPRFMVQDIDTAEDWEQAELMFKAFLHSCR